MTEKPGRQQLSGYLMRDYEHLAATLAAARLTKGITVATLGERLGVHKSSIVDWLGGRHGMNRERLFQIADALGYDLALIPREDE